MKTKFKFNEEKQMIRDNSDYLNESNKIKVIVLSAIIVFFTIISLFFE